MVFLPTSREPPVIPMASPAGNVAHENIVVADVVDGAAVGDAFAAAAASSQGPSMAKTRVEISSENLGGKSPATLVTIQPPDQTPTEAPSHHVCCVIDISGSMGADASVKDENGAQESSGLSVLDVVKHSIATILATMSENDYVSIVTFDTSSTVVCTRVQCSAGGKSTVRGHLEALSPQGSTNLWSGLRSGLDLVAQDPLADKSLASLFLFTDGMPNVEPPRGHLPTLERYLEGVGRLPCAVHAFGFGYNMDASLLQDISRMCAGSYAFIPDAGMVGTVFIHACANTFSAFAMDARLSVALPSGSTLAPDCEAALRAQYTVEVVDWGLVIHLGSLQYAQPRSIVLEFAQASHIDDIGLTYRTTSAAGRERADPARVASVPERSARAVAAAKRNELAKTLLELCSRNTYAPELGNITASLAQSLRAAAASLPPGSARTYVEAMLADAEGQVREAVSSAVFYKRWGTRYLRSLLSAHALEICNNFKDPGVQGYARGARFLGMRDKAEASFDAVPPPKPSRKRCAKPMTTAAMRNMYLNVSRGCFAGECTVDMAPGSPTPTKRICDLKAGDTVVSWQGKAALVTCVVRFKIDAAATDARDPLVALPGGLLITPYHPVYDAARKAWGFPCEHADATVVDARGVDVVYNFVLANGDTICVNGRTCVTLGHAFADPCVAHPYFGSDRVIHDLAKIPSFRLGQVTLSGNCFVRDPATNEVCGIDESCIDSDEASS